MLLRIYVTKLESIEESYILSKQKIDLLQEQLSLVNNEKDNYIKQLSLKDDMLKENLAYIKEKDVAYEEGIKQSYKKGLKAGGIIGLLGGLVLCLLLN